MDRDSSTFYFFPERMSAEAKKVQVLFSTLKNKKINLVEWMIQVVEQVYNIDDLSSLSRKDLEYLFSKPVPTTNTNPGNIKQYVNDPEISRKLDNIIELLSNNADARQNESIADKALKSNEIQNKKSNIDDNVDDSDASLQPGQLDLLKQGISDFF